MEPVRPVQPIAGESLRRKRTIKLPKPSDDEIRGPARLYLRCPECAAAIPVTVPHPGYASIVCTACGTVAGRP